MKVTQIVAAQKIGLSLTLITRMLRVGTLTGQPCSLRAQTVLVNLDQVLLLVPRVPEIKKVNLFFSNQSKRRFSSLEKLCQIFDMKGEAILSKIKNYKLKTEVRNGETFFSTFEVYLVLEKEPIFPSVTRETKVQVEWDKVQEMRTTDPPAEKVRRKIRPTTPEEWSKHLRSEWRRKFCHV